MASRPVPRPTILPLPLRELCARPGTSRPFSPRHADALAGSFDLSLFGRPIVNRVDGVSIVLDGQHRADAYRRQPGVTGDTLVSCEVYDDLTPEQIADLFLPARVTDLDWPGGSDSVPGAGD